MRLNPSRWRARIATLAVVLVASGCSVSGDPLGTDAPSTSATPTVAAPTSASPTSAASSTPTAGGATGAASAPASSAKPAAQQQLPRGGTTLFPKYRLVGYAGRTGSAALGRLGIGDIHDRMSELERRAKPYADGRTVQPVMEVIATVVQASPGRDKKYRTRMSDSQVKSYLAVARKHHALLLLAIQPGRSDFLSEVKAYDRWLAEPDVGVALDPEWALSSHQLPGRGFGHTTGAELDEVAAHLSTITTQHHLPQKVMVFHELAARVVTKESRLKQHPGVTIIKSVDGIGSRAQKTNTYKVVNEDTPKGVLAGFKLFYDEDKRTGKKLMTPAQVLALSPRPVYVMYE